MERFLSLNWVIEAAITNQNRIIGTAEDDRPRITHNTFFAPSYNWIPKPGRIYLSPFRAISGVLIVPIASQAAATYTP